MRCVRRSERVLAFAAFAAFLVGFASSTEAEQKPRRKTRAGEARCLEISVTSPQAEDERRSHRFSATEILDLQIDVRLPVEIDSYQRVVVRIFTPDGYLYQELPITTVGSEAKDASAPTRRHRRRERSSGAPKRVSGMASAILPVAGTSIVTSSLYGKWTAIASVDGADTSCARPTSFVITQ